MRRGSTFTKSQYSVASNLAVLLLSLASLGLLCWAFYAAGLTGLSPDQRTISSFFFALLAGGAGFFFGGVVLNLTGKIGSNVKLAIQAFSGSALFLAMLLHPLFASRELGRLEGSAEPNPSDTGIQITSPLAGGVVGPTTVVRGHTSYPRWHHYVVVNGLKAGGDTVQDGMVNVSPAGEITGNATIGSAAVGAGEVYTIQIVACETPLRPGPLSPKKDLILSNAITVTRSIQSEGS